ncbi:hypothetical protein NQZ68_017426 [Dissostichus eleginoides]|nr:hypothetical protein NQZ68_017426 [Dissostichus eleginoides]
MLRGAIGNNSTEIVLFRFIIKLPFYIRVSFNNGTLKGEVNRRERTGTGRVTPRGIVLVSDCTVNDPETPPVVRLCVTPLSRLPGNPGCFNMRGRKGAGDISCLWSKSNHDSVSEATAVQRSLSAQLVGDTRSASGAQESEMKFEEETLDRCRVRHPTRALKLDCLEDETALSGPCAPPQPEDERGRLSP